MARSALFNMTQSPHEDVKEFVHTVQEKARGLDMREKDLVEIILNGVHPNIRQFLTMNKQLRTSHHRRQHSQRLPTSIKMPQCWHCKRNLKHFVRPWSPRLLWQQQRQRQQRRQQHQRIQHLNIGKCVSRNGKIIENAPSQGNDRLQENETARISVSAQLVLVHIATMTQIVRRDKSTVTIADGKAISNRPVEYCYNKGKMAKQHQHFTSSCFGNFLFQVLCWGRYENIFPTEFIMMLSELCWTVEILCMSIITMSKKNVKTALGYYRQFFFTVFDGMAYAGIHVEASFLHVVHHGLCHFWIVIITNLK